MAYKCFVRLELLTALFILYSYAVELQYSENNNHYLHRRKRDTDITYQQMQAMSPGDRPNCKPGNVKPNIQVITTTRLGDLRALFDGETIEAYLIPSEDAHQSTYTSEYDKRRQFISGFTGSYGVAVVFKDRAALWTDGRYFLQAEDQLDCNWILMKMGEVGVPSVEQYVISIMKTKINKVYGADPFLVGSSAWQKSSKTLQEGGVTMKIIDNELIDRIWTTGNGRPARPNSVINALPLEFAGKSWQDKIRDMHIAMEKEDVSFMIVTELDETAWLFNLRAKDIPYNPFFISYATIERSTGNTVLYIIDHLTKLTRQPDDPVTNVTLAQHLNTGSTGSCTGGTGFCVEVKEYTNNNLLSDIMTTESSSTTKIWVSFLCNHAIFSRISTAKLHQANTPIALQKAKKNEVERAGMKRAHIRDAVALITFVAKLEKEVKEGKRWTEVSEAKELKTHRIEQLYNRGLSFPTISSSGSNGAVIHYTPTPETDKEITTREMYLLDSGGQYLDGTTDVTRTFHFGTPTDYEKECFTRVLIGHIDFARFKFVKGLFGREIDVIARGPLWAVGLQYRHGTGHGIGAYLGAGEGPGRISLSHGSLVQDSPLDEYQFFSDEPGYYEDGKFGIRHENIVMIKKATLKYAFPGTTFLEFETVTLVPYEPHLIMFDMLSEAQIDWLNKYYQKIRETILPLVKDDPVAYNWLNNRLGLVTQTGINTGSLTTASLVLLAACVTIKQLL